MLTHLAIHNIVLIDAAEVAFDAGLCVLTGETGAGKSILLDALGLALGARSESGLVRHGETQASVMAEFEIGSNAAAQTLLAELGIDPAGLLIIRRSVNADGKTRCFINDTPVSVAALKKLGETLVEVHGQHDQRGLLDPSTHRAQLDEYGKLDAYAGKVAAAHRHWKEASNRLQALEDAVSKARQEEDYLRHMAGELAAMDPQPGEEEVLSNARAEMMQAEKLFAAIDEALSELNRDKGVATQLRAAQRILLRSPVHTSGKFSSAVDTLERAAMEADEAQIELEQLARDAVYDPRLLESMEERLFALKAMARKYDVTVEGLPNLRQEVESRLKALDTQVQGLSQARKDRADTKARYEAEALQLTQARSKTARKLEKAIMQELEPLKMEGTRLRIQLEILPESAWSAAGRETVAFEVATNAGRKTDVPFSALHKIASGGELSRLMLALKVALSEVSSTPTLIFDEIDTGTGGAVADAIGQRLAELGKTAQVLVVTHMPQVAAKGNQHLRVVKRERNGSVTTRIEVLSSQERREEVARMLAGASITTEARMAAERLLENAG